MTIHDWVDVAWAYICDQSSAMMNPFEYRETLWTVLYEGEDPLPREKPDPAVKGQKALPRASRGMTAADKRELDNFNAEIERIKERNAAKATS